METLNQTDAQGLKQGPWVYYIYGSLWYKGSYLDGKPTGAWKYYGPNGNLRTKGSYLKGKEIGTWEQYDTDGTLEKIIYHH